MKLYKYLVWMFTFPLIGLFGCEDFLQENPRNFISPTSFFKSSEDAKSGLLGLYSVEYEDRRFISQGVVFLNQQMSEYAWPWSMTSADVGYISYSPDYIWIDKVWSRSYVLISRANSYIQQLQTNDIKFSEEVKKQYIAEAKFLRVLMYYYLVQLYGDVPLITEFHTETSDFAVPRNEASEIWEFCEGELKEAINSLPHKSEYSGADLSRANKEAAKMLLAKIYMINTDWTNADLYIDEIINSNEFMLEEDIVDNWDTSSEFGKESIFEINYASGFTPNLGGPLWKLSAPAQLKHPVTGQILGGASTGVAYTPFFYNSFDDEDLRKLKLFYDTARHDGPYGRFFTSKYFDPVVQHGHQGGWDQGPNNLVLFRYADVMLMKAEVQNELNNGPNAEAYLAIDKVRNRVNAPLIERNLNYHEFLKAVFDERGKELFFEGHRFFDLKRRGFEFLKNTVEAQRLALFDYIDYPGYFQIQEYMLLLPLPQVEVDANPKLGQNPGY